MNGFLENIIWIYKIQKHETPLVFKVTKIFSTCCNFQITRIFFSPFSTMNLTHSVDQVSEAQIFFILHQNFILFLILPQIIFFLILDKTDRDHHWRQLKAEKSIRGLCSKSEPTHLYSFTPLSADPGVTMYTDGNRRVCRENSWVSTKSRYMFLFVYFSEEECDS